MAIYDLASHLHMSVEDVLQLSYDEFTGWMEFLKRRPMGWREDSRFARLENIIRQVVGGKPERPEKIYPSLAKIYQEYEESDAKLKEQARSNQFYQMLSRKAVGDSDFLSFLDEDK